MAAKGRLGKYASTIRYGIGLAATVAGFALSVQLSDRGMLFTPEAPGALASAPATPSDYDLESLTVLSRVLLQMKDNYVQPDRIDPLRMLVYALDRVQNTVPEVVAIFDRDLDASPTQVEIRVGAASQSFGLDGIGSLWEMSFKMREIFRFVGDNIEDEDVDLRDVEYAAINGMLSTLDPHTVLLTPEIFREMQTANHGSFGGLGISIGIRDGKLTIISPIRDTPAFRAGFRAGDLIVQINGESTVNMPLDDAVSRLRGVEGTEVTVVIMRQGWSEPHEYTLRREIIEIDSVEHHVLGDGIGYISVSQFQERTQDEFNVALSSLREELGEMRGLVLDLRNNPGGLLQKAISLSDTFLAEGNIVTTVGVGARMREENAASRAGTEPTYPIVVLINPGSASASEIVAGALKNHGRALIVGDRSFGKGSVQVLYDFPDGSALKLTVAEYLTPGDVSIQGVGIVPDVELFGSIITDEMIDLYPSQNAFMREGDLEASLQSERTATEQERAAIMLRYHEEIEEADPDALIDPDAFEIDFQIDLARRILLASEGDAQRDVLLARASSVLADVESAQLSEIGERLRARGVDWSNGENVIQPVTIELSANRTDFRVEAGEPLELTATVTNTGARTLHRVRAASTSTHPLLDDREWVFGRLAPGESRSWTVRVNVPIEEPTRLERVQLDVFADTIELEAEQSALIRIDGQDRPRFGVSYRLDDVEGGNGDGMLQVGETVIMRTTIHNVGEGDASETSVLLRNKSDRALYLIEGRAQTDAIRAGEAFAAEFRFRIEELPEDGVLELDTEVYDAVFREYLREMIAVPVTTNGSTVEQRSGWLQASTVAPVLGGAGEGAAIVASLEPGDSLAFDRFANGYYHVRWDGGDGWVPVASVTLREAAPSSPAVPTERVYLQPPEIALAEVVVEANDPVFQLRGVIRDDTMVRDYYVIQQNLVGPRRTRSLKRSYSFVNQPTAELNDLVTLQPGMNRLTIVARDETRAVSTQELFVYLHHD